MNKQYPLIDGLSIESLKKMSITELEALSEEIRLFLISELSNTGGHLAPNLGVVELTMALFRVFDSPTDQFFWDIGHQTYVHKIITGRAKDFGSLRQYDGLSGFIKRAESEHDIWEAGHASTSLSGATGQTLERKLKKRNNHVVSIIGDGALTGGMALEALNHIGDLGEPHIIILNDNNMSISENVGAISRHINDLRVNPSYVKVKYGTKYFLSKIKTPGKVISDTLRWTKRKMKRFLLNSSESTFFDKMGIDYYGPIDGHNLEQLEDAFEYAKVRTRPLVLHVLTVKGKGYTPAETDASGAWHGIGPYSAESGQKLRVENRQLRQWSSVVSETLERFAQIDETIVAITPAMLKGSKLVHFNRKFPERTFDVGIAEEHAMTLSAGLALNGELKPFLAIYSTFIQRAYDQLLHDIARQHLNVIIGIDRCGFAGGDGDTHHGIYDISLLNNIPNMTIMMGKDAYETQQLMYNAFYQYHDLKGPKAIRYPRGYAELMYVSTFEEIPYGTWEYLQKNEENAIVILTFGKQLQVAQNVSNYFSERIDVINARFIKPLDSVMLDDIIQRYDYVITLEEGVSSGGFGSEVLNYLVENNADIKFKSFAIPDTFIDHGENAILEQVAGIDEKTMIKELIGEIDEA